MKDHVRVAVLVDIHGNYYALQAILDDASGFSPDCYVFGGDIVCGAAQPRQCMEKMRSLNAKGTFITHSTPRSCHDFLVLDPPNPGPTRSGQITADDAVREMLDGEAFDTMIYGHIHYTSERFFNGRRLMSIAPVGLPNDGDVRAGYALAEWENGFWKVVVRRVKYDYEGTARFIETSGQPFERRYAAMVRLAKHLPKSAEWGYNN